MIDLDDLNRITEDAFFEQIPLKAIIDRLLLNGSCDADAVLPESFIYEVPKK